MIVTVPALMALWSRWDVLNGHKRRYTLRSFRDVLVAANFRIEKISYYNSLLFLPVYAIRLFNRTFRKDSDRSDTEMPPRALNFALKKIFSFERFLLRFMRLPLGVSLVAVAKKIQT